MCDWCIWCLFFFFIWSRWRLSLHSFITCLYFKKKKKNFSSREKWTNGICLASLSCVFPLEKKIDNFLSPSFTIECVFVGWFCIFFSSLRPRLDRSIHVEGMCVFRVLFSNNFFIFVTICHLIMVFFSLLLPFDVYSLTCVYVCMCLNACVCVCGCVCVVVRQKWMFVVFSFTIYVCVFLVQIFFV